MLKITIEGCMREGKTWTANKLLEIFKEEGMEACVIEGYDKKKSYKLDKRLDVLIMTVQV